MAEALDEVFSGIAALPDQLRIGSLNIWGQVIGRPGENEAEIVEVKRIGRCIQIVFDDKVLVKLDEPSGFLVTESGFEIRECERIVLEGDGTWYAYSRQGNLVSIETNAPFQDGNRKPHGDSPAFLLFQDR